ncbi:hypothetical protein [Brytella acorum]|uniref:Uncharacterized protein n=1 Tax=Brytella acorum TaxID=2959299 RepID=A0AA35UQV6_9PROT|nr:hypothetical protein [Brytella acorum]CAI9120454.1 hypothetical protein LMG32879_001287 [Brytella acorum]
MRRFTLLFALSLPSLALAQTAPQPIGPTGLPVPIGPGVIWSPDMWKAAFEGYVTTSNGAATNTALKYPILTGGSATGTDLSAATVVPFSGASSVGLGKRLGETASVQDFAAAADGVTPDDAAVLAAFATSPVPEVNFPYTARGYFLATGMPNNTLGIYRLNGNAFSGAGVGTPETGASRFNATYTNPYNVTTNLKYEFDPAALPEKNNVTNQGISVECRPNRPNPGNPNPNRNWVACMYRGMDTGTGGAPGTSINSEVDNDVLNLSSNSGTDYEIDVNFNGRVLDGGVSRALFLTGGGGAGNNTTSVALDIMHSAYDGSWLPWTTGISIREATDEIELYRTQAIEAGYFLRAFDQNGAELSHLDKMGNLSVQGLQLMASSTPTVGTGCKKGTISFDDSYLYVCTSALTYKRVALGAMQ